LTFLVYLYVSNNCQLSDFIRTSNFVLVLTMSPLNTLV